MSFLDDLAGGILGAGLGFLTGGPAGAIAGGAIGSGLIGGDEAAPTQKALPLSNTSLTSASAKTVSIPVQNAPGLLSQIGSAIGGTAASLIGGAVGPTAAAAVVGAPGACPTGKNRVRTIIQVIKPDGTVCSQKIEAGRPFLMNRDIVTAKRVFRTVAKVAGRLPKRTVKQSRASMLSEAAVNKALRDVNNDNGNGGCK